MVDQHCLGRWRVAHQTLAETCTFASISHLQELKMPAPMTPELQGAVGTCQMRLQCCQWPRECVWKCLLVKAPLQSGQEHCPLVLERVSCFWVLIHSLSKRQDQDLKDSFAMTPGSSKAEWCPDTAGRSPQSLRQPQPAVPLVSLNFLEQKERTKAVS